MSPRSGVPFTMPSAPVPATSAPSLAASPPATSVPAVTPALVASPTPGPTPSPSPSPSPSASAVPPTWPLTLTDDEQNVVTLAAEPKRIVSLTPATTEIVYALGAGSRLIAGTDADDYPAKAMELPHVATYSSVDVEKIVGLNADLVIAGGNNFNKPEALAQLRRVGIPVLVVYGADVEGVLHDIDLVGRAIGRPAEAAVLVDAMRAQFQVVADATASLPHPRVFYELDATKEIYGPADRSFIAEMISLAGGTPITTGSTTVFSIPLEVLLQANPEVIILGDAAYGTTAVIVAARPGWSSMSAVRTSTLAATPRPSPVQAAGTRTQAGCSRRSSPSPPCWPRPSVWAGGGPWPGCPSSSRPGRRWCACRRSQGALWSRGRHRLSTPTGCRKRSAACAASP